MSGLSLNIGNRGVFKQELIQNPKVVVRASKYGYGVFATSLINKGEVIEECVIAEDRIPPHSTILNNYKFRGIQSEDGWFDGVVVIGRASLLNHSDSFQNVEIYQNLDYERLVVIYAIKDIKPEEELFWWYGNGLV